MMPAVVRYPNRLPKFPEALRNSLSVLIALLLAFNSLPVFAQNEPAITAFYTPQSLVDQLVATEVNRPSLLEIIPRSAGNRQLTAGNLLVGNGASIVQIASESGKSELFSQRAARNLAFGLTNASPLVLTNVAMLQLSDGSRAPLGSPLLQMPTGESLVAIGNLPGETSETFVVLRDGELVAVNPTQSTMAPIAVGNGLPKISSLAFIPDTTGKSLGSLWAALPSQNKLLRFLLTQQENALQANLVGEIGGLVKPVVVRYSATANQLWVLSQGDSSLRVLDGTGAAVRQLQLPSRSWNSFALSESADKVYLTSLQGQSVQLWQMPVSALQLVSPKPESSLQGSTFDLEFSRRVSLESLTNKNVQLNLEGSAQAVKIGLQLSGKQGARIIVLEPFTGPAILTLTSGLKDIYGNSLPETRFKVQLTTLSQSNPQSSVGGSGLTAPTANSQPIEEIGNTNQVAQSDAKVQANAAVATNAVALPSTLIPLTSGFNLVRSTATSITYTQQVTAIANASTFTLNGPLYLNVENLPTGISLITANAGFNLQTGGLLVPVIDSSSSLTPGQSININTVFNNPSFTQFTYTRRVLNASQLNATGTKLRTGSLKSLPLVQQNVTVQNTSGSDLKGPLYVAVQGLPSSTTLYNKTGNDPTSGLPLVAVDLGTAGKLSAGQSATVLLQFQGTSTSSLSYTPALLGIAVPANGVPRIDTLSPAQLSVNQVSRLILTGVNLANITQVQFSSGNDIVGRIIWGTDVEKVIEVTVNPVAVTGARTVTVSNSSGASNTLSFTVIAPPPVAANTTISGKVLSGGATPTPLAGVRVFLDQFPGYGDAFTDSNGNFTLSNIPARITTLAVDGQVISNSTVAYPKVIIPAQIGAGLANRLPYTVYLTANDPAGVFQIPSTISQDIILTNPNAPGLKVKLPAGIKITRPDGTAVTQITVSTVTPDRLPMPLPTGVSTIQALSIQPADAVLSEPVQVTFPNLSKTARPGDVVSLYRADHETESGQFVPYGTGTVSADGKLIVPDTNPATGKPYGLPTFSWHFPPPPPPPPPASGGPDPDSQGPPDSCPSGAGGSVDLASGTEKYETTDIRVLGGRVPFSMDRVYRSGSIRQGPFGIGSYHNFELIIQEQSAQLVQLVQSNNYRTNFSTSQSNQFVNSDSPQYRGAVLTKNSGNYSLRLKTGEIYTFDSLLTSNGQNNYFLTKMTDRNNNTITVARDGNGNATGVISPSGSLTFLLDSTTGHIQQVTDQGGRTVVYQYDSQNRLTQVTDPAGQVKTYTYDGKNQLLATTNARGFTDYLRTYDANGRITSEQLADGSQIRFQYTLINPSDSNSGIASTKVLDPNGNSTTYRIDSGLYTCSIIDGFGNQDLINRNAGSNRILSTVDRLNRTTSAIYDANENLTQLQTPDGAVNQYSYDSTFNLPVSITNAINNTYTILQDTKGNPTQLINPLNKVTGLAYDSFGQITLFTNALNQSAQYAYDTRGNVTGITDPLGHTVLFTYDALNRISSASDALGNTTTYQYDLLNRLIQNTSPEGRITKFSYDSNDNLTQVIDRNNSVTTFAYDSRDRRISRTDASGQSEIYVYDPVGNLTRFIDRKGQITNHLYDANNRLTTTTYADSTVVTRTYAANNRLDSANDTAGGAGQHTFTFDALDRLLRETNPRGTITNTYDLIGRRTSLNINNNTTINFSYNANNRLTQIVEGTDTFNLSYDALDRRIGIAMPNGVSATYNYDSASRLLEILYKKGASVLLDLAYTYDNANRRISTSGNPVALPSENTYNTVNVNGLNQYTAIDGQTLTYDTNGSLTQNNTSGSQASIVFDARNRVQSISRSGTTTSFTYDPFGRRTGKTTSGIAQTFLYDGQDLVQAQGNNAATYTFSGLIDQPLVRRTSANEYYLSDAIGSVIALTNGSGAISTSYNYTAFGQAQSSGSTSGNPFTFVGREDDGTGYLFYRARYYSPDTRRFISQDPLDFLGGNTNLYTYVRNNPVNFVDPYGTCDPPFVPKPEPPPDGSGPDKWLAYWASLAFYNTWSAIYNAANTGN